MSEITISEHDEQMFRDLRLHNLRHPGTVKPSIVRLMKRQYFSSKELGDLRLEWLKLGLNGAKK